MGPVENALFKAGLLNKLRNTVCRTGNESQTPYSPYPSSPYFREEQVVQTRRKNHRQPVKVACVTPKAKTSWSKAKLLMVADLHGEKKPYDFVKGVMQRGEIKFLAMEMIPHTMQEVVDDYIRSDKRSPKYLAAKKALEDHFADVWDSKFGDKKSPSPYLALVNLAREKKIRVVTMDVAHDYYEENPQRDPLIVGTRNLVWAKQVLRHSRSERGLVFGGSYHFISSYAGIRVQDFLAPKVPPSQMVIVTFENVK